MVGENKLVAAPRVGRQVEMVGRLCEGVSIVLAYIGNYHKQPA